MKADLVGGSAGPMVTSAKRDVVVSATSKLVIAGASACVALIVARQFGGRGLGLYAMLRTLPAVFAIVTDPGLALAVPYLINRKKLTSAKVYSVLICCAFLVAVPQFAIWTAFAHLFHSRLFPDLSMGFVLLFGISIPITSAIILLSNLSRAKGEMVTAGFIAGALDIVGVVAFVFLWLLDARSLESIAVAQLAVSAFALIVSARLAGEGFYVPSRTEVFEIGSAGLSFGVKSQMSNALQILNYRLDVIILGMFVSTSQIGIYFVATKAVEIFRFFGLSTVFALEPRLGRQSERDAFWNTKKLAPVVFGINFVLVLGGALFAPVVLPLFGTWAAEAIFPMYVLSVGLMISGANSTFCAYYLGTGRPEIPLYFSLAGFAVTVIFGVPLIDRWGITGAAILSSFAYSTISFCYWIHFHRHSGMRPKKCW